MTVVGPIWHALAMSLSMLWGIFWGISLGFLFSAIIEVVVSKEQMSRLLPDAGGKSLAKAMTLGAISSSCSYAAVAMARSIVRKGGDFTAAMVFQLAATNLVLELIILMWLLLAWQFALAEILGCFIMVAIIAVLFRLLAGKNLKEDAVRRSTSDARGAMEGHAAMSMGKRQGPWQKRLLSRKGWIAVSHYFVMNWTMLWKDIGIGLLVAGMLSAWVPKDFWSALFLTDHPHIAVVWNILLGPIIAIVSFTCSIGNIPLAVVLWNGGLSFGGVAAFIFADLIIPPLINIYRKYYGVKMTAFLFMVYFVAMAAAGAVIQMVFSVAGRVPEQRHQAVMNSGIQLNYTTVLDVLFGLATLILLAVFLKTGGPDMMRMMNRPGAGHEHHHDHAMH
ncbi:permease [Martelella alba]|uniref:Permease n=1 Tax=Martelella alba TaxID=2590451 RepID=A0ABY2SDW0_9HYPH|nr:permease [Martelella alba]TKI02807.1 permease [Martelella alba]